MALEEQNKEQPENTKGVSPFSAKTIHYIKDFIETVPPARLKKNLLNSLLIYLESDRDTLPKDFRQVADDYYLLFHLLDKLEEELQTKNP
jgi:hypothetical protein